MNYLDIVKEKLVTYSEEDIIITEHARQQALFRSVSLEDVKKNILKPEKLSYAYKEEAKNSKEEKYDCYFGYSKTQCQRYILVLKKKCIVCTVIKINRRWQRMVENMEKINFSYDQDSLLLYKAKEKSKGSVEIGDLILDFNNKKELVGIQILSVSSFIASLTGKSAPFVKRLLQDLQQCKFEVVTKNNLLIIRMVLCSSTEELTPTLSLPHITQSSPAVSVV